MTLVKKILFCVYVFSLMLSYSLNAEQESRFISSPERSVNFDFEKRQLDVDDGYENDYLQNFKGEGVQTIYFTWRHFIINTNNSWTTWIKQTSFPKLKNFHAQWFYDSKAKRSQEYGSQILRVLQQLIHFQGLESVTLKLDRMENVFNDETMEPIFDTILALDVKEFTLTFSLNKKNFNEKVYLDLELKKEELIHFANMKINFEYDVHDVQNNL